MSAARSAQTGTVWASSQRLEGWQQPCRALPHTFVAPVCCTGAARVIMACCAAARCAVDGTEQRRPLPYIHTPGFLVHAWLPVLLLHHHRQQRRGPDGPDQVFQGSPAVGPAERLFEKPMFACSRRTTPAATARCDAPRTLPPAGGCCVGFFFWAAKPNLLFHCGSSRTCLPPRCC